MYDSVTEDYIKRLEKRVDKLEAALVRIKEHPHNCSTGCLTELNPQYSNLEMWGQQEGHRCAAQIAAEALREEE